MKSSEKVLFIGRYSPELGSSSFGAIQRTENILNSILSTRKCDLALLTLRENDELIPSKVMFEGNVHFINGTADKRILPPRVEKLLPGKIYRIIEKKNYIFSEFPFSSQASDELRAVIKGYDVIVCRYFGPVFFCALDRIISPSTRLVIDVDDDPCEVIRTRASLGTTTALKRFFLTLYLSLIKHRIRQMADRANLLWFVKEGDQKRFRNSENKSSILFNIPHLGMHKDEEMGGVLDNKTILFVGLLGFAPNRKGLMKFVKDCWSKIKRKVPDAKLVVIGKGLDEESQGILTSYPDIEYRGFVDDLSCAYSECRFTIAPIYEGAGSKIKILESLAYKRTCVVTAHAYEGISNHMKDRQCVRVGEDENGFAECCVELLGNYEMVLKLGEHGNRVIRDFYSEESFSRVVRASLDKVTAS